MYQNMEAGGLKYYTHRGFWRLIPSYLDTYTPCITCNFVEGVGCPPSSWTQEGGILAERCGESDLKCKLRHRCQRKAARSAMIRSKLHRNSIQLP